MLIINLIIYIAKVLILYLLYYRLRYNLYRLISSKE